MTDRLLPNEPPAWLVGLCALVVVVSVAAAFVGLVYLIGRVP